MHIHQGELLKAMIKRKMDLNKFAPLFGMTRQNLYTKLKNVTLSEEDINKACEILKIDSSVFYPKNIDNRGGNLAGNVGRDNLQVSDPNETYGTCMSKLQLTQEKVVVLEKLVSRLENTVTDKDLIIQLLRKNPV
ncbi:MAG: hypothetical protein ACK40G_13745 [Cytophagaceae bacterium]